MLAFQREFLQCVSSDTVPGTVRYDTEYGAVGTVPAEIREPRVAPSRCAAGRATFSAPAHLAGHSSAGFATHSTPFATRMQIFMAPPKIEH